MNTIRRLYIYLVCFISVQIVAWATILLGQNLFVETLNRESLAWQIALLVIAGPIFVIHWLWARRLAKRESQERAAALRSFYLYLTLAVLLVPLLFTTFEVINAGLIMLAGAELSTERTAVILSENIIAAVILALFWGYHEFVRREDEALIAPENRQPLLQRLYRWFFTATTLFASSIALAMLIQSLWDLTAGGQLGDFRRFLIENIAVLLVTLPAWVIFWRWNQQLYATNVLNEQASTLRKIYLYLVAFYAAVVAVTNATIILDGIFRRLFGLESMGSISEVLPALLVAAAIWGYQTWIIRSDLQATAEQPRQAALRRLYWYTMAAIGLAVVLIGVGGQLSILIRYLTAEAAFNSMREEAAWFLASAITGLFVWLWPWWRIQQQTAAPGERSIGERRSLIRRIYLFGYLFLATMTVLASGVYIVYRLLTRLMGVDFRSSLFNDLAHALAFALLAAAVLLYHGWLLRQDQERIRQWLKAQYARLKLTILDNKEGQLGEQLAAAVPERLPGLQVEPYGLSTAAAARLNATATIDQISTALQESAIIIGPWSMMLDDQLDGAAEPHIVDAINASSATKLIIPTALPGWTWTGLKPRSEEELVKQAIADIQKVADKQLLIV